MPDRHESFKENLAAYALGALDAGERVALERHLRTCRTCPTDLEAYQRVSDGLLTALPPHSPPAALRHRLQQRVGAAKSERPRFSWSFDRLGLAAALTLLIGLSIFSVVQIHAVQQQQAELERANTSAQTAIAMLAYPGTQSVTFDQNGIAGSLLVDKSRNLLAVFAWHLPPAPSGKTYQVWLINTHGQRTSGGFLTPEAGYPFVTAVISAPSALSGFSGIGVTTEPLGGSPAPTGTRIFGADF